jgi:hypothetical protein
MIDSNDVTNKNENADDKNKSEKEITQKDNPSQNKITILGTHPKNPSCQKIKKYCTTFLKIIILILKALYKLFIGHAISYYYTDDNPDSNDTSNIEKYASLNSINKAKFESMIQDIINIEPCFSEILKDPEFTENKTASRESFIQYIKEHDKYLCEAYVKFIIICLIMISYLVIRVLIDIEEYNCIKTEENLNNVKYWICNNYSKCKVTKRKWINILRFTYYFINYFCFLCYKGILLFTFECKIVRRFQKKLHFIILYKSLEYGLLIAIIVYDYKDDSVCYKSKSDKNLFVQIYEYKLRLIFSILDLIFPL